MLSPIRSALIMLALAGAATAQEGAVPECTDLPWDAAGMADCALVSDPLLFAFLYDTVPDGAVLRITQATAEGGARVTSPEIPVKGVRQAPSLYDIDGDGTAELFVPISLSASETVFQVWRQGEDGFFVYVDAVSSLVPQSFSPLGDLIIHVGPTMNNRTVESAYIFDDTGLTRIYAVQMDRAAGSCAMVEGTSVWNEAIILADCEARLGETELEGQ